MAQILRQSTQIIVRIGPFVDVADGFTPETGITLSGADEAEALKANGAATTDISGATWAAITGADGWYNLTLTASHTDTVGTLDIVVNDDSVCLPVFARFMVIEEAAFDSFHAASADPKADINVATIDANAITATAIQDNAITAAKIADGAIDAATFAAGAITATVIATGAIDADAIAADAITDAKVAADVTIASVTGAVGSVAGAVGSVTGNVGGNVTGSIGSLGAQAKLDVNAEADTAIADAALATAANLATVDTVVDGIKAKTDSLTFTVAGEVDANIQAVNDVEITGDGDGTPWGPA